jgi:hypothetical protein
MSITPVNFFEMSEPDVIRNGSTGSPRLIPRGLEAAGIRSDYTRASYMADFLEEKDHIHKWEMRYLAKAMGQNEDLAALAACETYSTGLKDAPVGREKSASGRRLDEIIERAFDRVRLHEKADRGTAVHGFTEPAWWAQEPPEGIPERLRDPVASFWARNQVEGVRIVDTGRFTANDITMSAGTFDHLAQIPGHPLFKDDLLIGDKKTGRFDPFSWMVQTASYAWGDPYDTATDTRPAWPGTINKDYSLIWHIDCEPTFKGPLINRTKLYLIDIRLGWEMAQIAATVRDAHERKDISTDYQTVPFETRLANCTTKDSLGALWWATTDPEQRAQVEAKGKAL